MEEPKYLNDFEKLISSHELWLVQSTLKKAMSFGYTQYTSTLLEAWRVSVEGLSQALITMSKKHMVLNHINSNFEANSLLTRTHLNNPLVQYGIEQARVHRQRGVDLAMFLGSMKNYRNAYLELISEKCTYVDYSKLFAGFITEMFDLIEIGCSSEWASLVVSEEFLSLQKKNRDIMEDKLYYLTVFESIDNPIIVVTADGKIKNMNNSACLYFTQYDTKGAVYYGDKDISQIENILAPLLSDKSDLAEFLDYELPTVRGVRRFHIKIKKMADSSERFAGAVVICSDITEYMQALYDAAVADRVKSNFLATMSHELRTPAAGILGAVDLLKNTSMDKNQLHLLDLVDCSASSLLGVLNEILDYSRYNAVEVEKEITRFSLRGLVNDILKVVEHQLFGKKISLSVLVPPLLPDNLLGDADKLRRLLLNLVGNAVKFTEAGSISISVDLEKNSDDLEPRLLISVTDTGIGISSEIQDKLFEPFLQADASIARRFGGTGLGLAICKRIIDAFGGDIGVDSQSGQGSRFWFTFPYQETYHEEKLPTYLETPGSASLKILLIEDNAINQFIAKKKLEQAGHHLYVASNGEDGLAYVEKHNVDVILLDLHLPGMDGQSVLQHLKSSPSEMIRTIPVFMLSADTDQERSRQSAIIGSEHFFAKPLNVKEFHQTCIKIGILPSVGIKEKINFDDRVLIDHIEHLGYANVKNMIDAFKETTLEIRQDLIEAVDKNDHKQIIFSAHKLKGASLNLGLKELAYFAGHIETGTKSMSKEDISDAIEHIKLQMLKYNHVLERFLVNQALSDIHQS